MIKRMLSLLIAAAAAFSFAMPAALPVHAEQEREVDFSNGHERELMVGLGIIENSDSEKNVTRADFFQMISKMVYFGEDRDYTNVPSGEKPFSDIDSYHYAAANMQRLLTAGIISGDGNGLAEPDRDITAVEAYAVMLNAAGYKKAAAAYGSYPDNYIKMAAETGLSKGVPGTKQTITLNDAAVMLTALLDIKAVKIDSLAESGAEYVKKGSFAAEVMDLTVGTGIIRAADGLTMSSKEYNDKIVVIDDDILTSEKSGYGALLGYSVKYYCAEDELIYAMPHRNTVLSIDSEDIESYGTREYKYIGNKDRTKTAKTDKNVVLLSNGFVTDDLNDFTPNYGSVTLVDNNRDGVYDVIFAENYETGWIESLVTDGDTINFSNEITDGEKSVSLKDYDEYKIVNEDGIEIAFDSLKQNELVTIKRFKKQSIEVILSKTSVSGVVRNIDKYGKYTELDIGEEKYVMKKDAYIRLWNGSNGVNVTAHIDARGKISAVIGGESDGWQYGFMIKARYAEEDETLKIKMLTQNGAVQSYFITEQKIKIDGNKLKLSDAADNLLNSSVVRYFLKGNTISAIDLPRDVGMTEERAAENKNSNDMLLRRAAGKFVYYNKNVFKRNVTTNSIDGEIIPVNASIPVFMVPAKDEMDNASDKLFSVESLTAFSNNRTYTMEAFNIDTNEWYTDVIVAYGADVAGGYESPMMISAVNMCVSEDNEIVYSVEGYVDGKSETYYTSDTMTADLSKLLTAGDVVRFSKNGEGKIIRYEIIYSKNGGGRVSEKASATAKYDAGGLDRFSFGYINRINGGILQFNNWDDDYAEYFDTVWNNIIVYDPDERTKVRSGNINDVVTKVNSLSGYDRIVLWNSYTEQKCIWVIK